VSASHAIASARAAHAQRAAERAVDYLRPGMVVGLGGGTTVLFALRKLAALLRAGELHDLLGVSCSTATSEEARRLGIPLTTLAEHPVVDVTIDGADEVDPDLNLIKGGGGALLHEKIVAQASRREIIVVDDSKLSPALGTNRRLPVEVSAFGWRGQVSFLELLGATVVDLRLGAGRRPFETEEGHLLLDCQFGPIAEPVALAARLQRRAGVVEHGLFLGLATDLIVAGDGGIRHLERQRHRSDDPPGERR
jgi:ribose 5-phosphate isomerase A